jgi:hypothetical protein
LSDSAQRDTCVSMAVRIAAEDPLSMGAGASRTPADDRYKLVRQLIQVHNIVGASPPAKWPDRAKTRGFAHRPRRPCRGAALAPVLVDPANGPGRRRVGLTLACTSDTEGQRQL